ncbi:shikimate kinase [Actinoplanes sp. NPDC048796]|uniref:shikimate kinase n=1 Tax=Actinoplanes sp. NPDC048796 TaxID=3155640 RepID=UPI0033F26BD9
MSLPHVYWIGGASGAGKSTIARTLAARHGLRLYDTDAVMREHAARSTEPQLSAFLAMSMDERWVDRSPQVMLDTFHWYRGEAFDLIIEDLRRLPTEPGIIAEGFRLLPHLVRPHLPSSTPAVWLLPTPAFRRAAFDSRGSTWQIAGRTSDPERALANLLERDRLFTERLRDELTREDLPAITVEPGLTEEELTDQVSHCLKIHRVR